MDPEKFLWKAEEDAISLCTEHICEESRFIWRKGVILIGPCDASDVAQGFYLVVCNPDASADEIFNVGSADALTAKRFADGKKIY